MTLSVATKPLFARINFFMERIRAEKQYQLDSMQRVHEYEKQMACLTARLNEMAEHP